MSAGQIRRIGAGAVIAAVAAAGVASAAPGGAQSAAAGATIKMKLEGKRVFFAGPKTVKHGAKLEIVNKTDPKEIGPHTFTLATEDNIPQTKKEQKACGKFESEVCAAVLEAHKANPETGEVKKKNVDARKTGWDKAFGKRGDTWFTEKKGASQSRKVSAAAGTTLSYFCVVHPEMTGEIKVVE